MATIAILGGSFHPPHVGHLLAAQYVHATQEIDEVWLTPAYRHPFGKELPPFEARLEMCEALCLEASGWLKASRAEQELAGSGWTVELLEFLTGKHPGNSWVVVMGSDIVRDLPRWKDVERIRELARILVVNRAGTSTPEAVGPPLARVSSTEIRKRLERGDPCAELIPRRVREVARKLGLYGTAKLSRT